MRQYGSIDDSIRQRKDSGSKFLLGALCATAAAGLLVALTASPPASSVVLMRKHLLSAHEREEFRQFQLSQMMPKISKPAPGSGWPYADEPANRLGPLGASVYAAPPERRDAMKRSIMRSFQPRASLQGLEGQYQGNTTVSALQSTSNSSESVEPAVEGQNPGNYSDTNPPCFTATDCHTRAVANHLYETNDANGELPTYDGDTMEMIAAMQKQVYVCFRVGEYRIFFCVCACLCALLCECACVFSCFVCVCVCVCVCFIVCVRVCVFVRVVYVCFPLYDSVCDPVCVCVCALMCLSASVCKKNVTQIRRQVYQYV
jgi:hypothetical protein